MNTELLNYKTYGEYRENPLLIVHGLFGSLDNWMSLAKNWASKHFVIIVDVRNHGKSFHSDKMDFEDLTKDLLNVLDKENIEKTHLLGHSMGGKIAMEFAGNYPERLKKLIIVDVAPYPYKPHHSDVFNMLHKVDLGSCESRADIENQIRQYIKSEPVVQFMSKNIKRNEENLNFEWKFNLSVLDREYIYLIQRVAQRGFTGEVLFIGGENSQYITKETSEHIFELYPNFELEFVSNAGHWVHADNPQEFYSKVNDFINK